MGYRWYKGRLLSDDEYSNLIKEEGDDLWYSIGMFIPIVISGFIGYVIGDGWGCFFGIVFLPQKPHQYLQKKPLIQSLPAHDPMMLRCGGSYQYNR